MSRIVKCQFCGISDTAKSEMEFELVGKAKPVRKYYHKHCFSEHLKEKEFKQKEAQELDSLKETIEKIFGVKELPHQVYPLLQNLRNGDKVFGNQSTGKRYKEGYSYKLIEETFIHCEDTINYWLSTKSDFNGFMGAFKYCLAIVIDKIYIVEKRVKELENKDLLIEKHIENINKEQEIFESNYNNSNKDTSDITEFLDD